MHGASIGVGWAPGVDYTQMGLQTVVDAQNIAFADRNKYMGDADFINLPVPPLLTLRRTVFTSHTRSGNWP